MLLPVGLSGSIRGMSAPGAYVQWMNEHLGFNPRSQTNSNALSDAVVADVLRSGSVLGKALTDQVLLSRKNIDVETRVATRNIDLVFEDDDSEISFPVTVENKTIMAAHGKARRTAMVTSSPTVTTYIITGVIVWPGPLL